MAKRTLIRGGTVITLYNAHPGLVDTILVDGVIVKRDGELLGVDAARVRRLAIEAGDDILRRAEGANGARPGGDWIPEPYEAAKTA
jgi:5-methylthioadenosine/S-adenosylhomocysteine deaminase